MMKLLRGAVAEMPPLHFLTQQQEGQSRPDMLGTANAAPRAYIENKFWAGLTDNQPVAYLQHLSAYPQPTLLLVIAPAAREHTLWRELRTRIINSGIGFIERAPVAGIPRSAQTELGPFIGLSSWPTVLSVMEHEAADDPRTRGDLLQLRALCDAADDEAFVPVTGAELTDQRTPAFIIQLNAIVQETVDYGVTEGILDVSGLRPQASGERIGRYARFGGVGGAGAWIGVHFLLWKSHGPHLYGSSWQTVTLVARAMRGRCLSHGLRVMAY